MLVFEASQPIKKLRRPAGQQVSTASRIACRLESTQNTSCHEANSFMDTSIPQCTQTCLLVQCFNAQMHGIRRNSSLTRITNNRVNGIQANGWMSLQETLDGFRTVRTLRPNWWLTCETSPIYAAPSIKQLAPWNPGSISREILPAPRFHPGVDYE